MMHFWRQALGLFISLQISIAYLIFIYNDWLSSFQDAAAFVNFPLNKVYVYEIDCRTADEHCQRDGHCLFMSVFYRFNGGKSRCSHTDMLERTKMHRKSPEPSGSA